MAFQGNFNGKFSTQVLMKLKKPIKEIAYDIGVPYKTLWNWIRGVSTYPPDKISKLYQSTKDRRIFDFFLHPAGFVALEDPDGKGRELIEKAAKALKELWEFMDYKKEAQDD